MNTLESAVEEYARAGAGVKVVNPYLGRKSWEDELWEPIGGGIAPDAIAQVIRKGILNSISGAAVRMVATSFPDARLKVMQRDPGGEDVEVDNHWLTQLLRDPNPWDDEFTVLEAIAQDANLAASYWELVRASDHPDAEVIEMHRLLPHTVQPQVHPVAGLIGYDITPTETGEAVRLDPYQVLAIGFPKADSHFAFWSPLQSAATELNIDLNLSAFVENYFENGAVPGGLLTSEQRFSEREIAPFIERFKRAFSWRRRKAGEVSVLPNGITYQQVTANFKDMDIENIIKITETRICGAFGVDPVLIPTYVGIKEGGKYASYTEARSHFWDETLIPLGKRVAARFTKQLLRSEPEHYVAFDYSAVRALQEDETERAGRVVSLKAGGLITLNEGRAQLDLDPVAGGDELAQPEPPPDDDPPEDEEEKRAELDTKAVAQFGRRLFDTHDKLVPDYHKALQGVIEREKKA